jgi:hypothetical protein
MKSQAGVSPTDEENRSEKSTLVINFNSDHDDDVTDPDRGAVETTDPGRGVLLRRHRSIYLRRSAK